MIEAGRLEARLELLGEPLVLAQHDSREHGSTLALESGRDRAGHVGAQPVRQPTDPAAASDHAPVPAAENHVDAAPRQPAPLVEAASGRARRDDRRPQGEDRALGRRSTERQLEKDGLTHPLRCEAKRISRHPQRESRPPGRSGDHDFGLARTIDVGGEDALVESFESGASPPPADECEREDEASAGAPARRRRDRGDEHSAPVTRRTIRSDTRNRDAFANARPEAGGDDEHRWAGPLDHGPTSSRSWSIRTGPMPGIASRSSTVRKPPCAAR